MITQPFTDEELAGIRLTDLVGYLDGNGWSRTGTFGDHGWVYEYETGGEIIVPKHEDVADYAFAVRNILRGIARLHGNEPTVAYHDVRFQRHDIIRIQAVDTDSDSDTITPDAASDLFIGAKRLWEGSVKSSLGNTDAAKEYWEQARFGQTERGSYVVTMLSPPVYLGQQITFGTVPSEPPPTRKVTNSIRTAIQQARSIATEVRRDGDAAIERAHAQGVKVGAFEAIEKMIEPFQTVSCTITESNIDPTVTRDPSVTRFEQQDVPILKDVTAGLKELELREPMDQTLNGYILRCERRRESEIGKLTLHVLMPGLNTVQTVHTEVGDEEYRLALEVHGLNKTIDAKGKLKQTAKSTWRLEDAKIRRSRALDWD